MFNALIAAVLADPVKSLLGSGGVLGVLVLIGHWWLTHPRVFARGFAETFDTNDSPNIEIRIRVELENRGRESTSLDPIVNLRYIYPQKGVNKYSLEVQEQDRTLPPVTPKIFHLKAIVPAGYVFSHFRIFMFSVSRGRGARIRILNVSGQSAGTLKFWAREALYRIFGALPHIRG